MSEKFSDSLIVAAIKFIRTAKHESGNSIDDEKINRMLDAFDPALRQQIFVTLLTGNENIDNIRSSVLLGKTANEVRIIKAIKAIRQLTGLGLRETEQIVNDANSFTPHSCSVRLPGCYTLKEQENTNVALEGSGFKLI